MKMLVKVFCLYVAINGISSFIQPPSNPNPLKFQNPCAVVRCASSTICVVKRNGRASCEKCSITPCAKALCPRDSVCVPRRCGKSACIPNNPCAKKKCHKNRICIVTKQWKARCVAKLRRNPCANKKCEKSTCVARNNRRKFCEACRITPCSFTSCVAPSICVARSCHFAECVNPCAKVNCKNGKVCKVKNGRPRCETPCVQCLRAPCGIGNPCKSDQVCIPNSCACTEKCVAKLEEDPCEKKKCRKGTVCIARSNNKAVCQRCETNPCSFTSCKSPSTCIARNCKAAECLQCRQCFRAPCSQPNPCKGKHQRCIPNFCTCGERCVDARHGKKKHSKKNCKKHHHHRHH